MAGSRIPGPIGMNQDVLNLNRTHFNVHAPISLRPEVPGWRRSSFHLPGPIGTDFRFSSLGNLCNKNINLPSNAGSSHATVAMGWAVDNQEPRLESKAAMLMKENRFLIREAINRGDYQRAINLAAKSIQHRGGAIFQKKYEDEGWTDGDTGQAYIGMGAFIDKKTKVPHSIGWLASTIAHENVHVRQQKIKHPNGGSNWGREATLGSAVNEIQAYDFELRIATGLGLSQAEIAKIKEYRDFFYQLIASDPIYSSRISPKLGSVGNNYWLKVQDKW